MIPKIIHYTWFSGEEMPPIVKDCIASWKRVMPDYEFRLWDRASIQNLDSDFLQEALVVKKWAYAADYVRLYALYHEGGIYLDTDVMVFKSFDDLLQHQTFIGKEDAINQLQLEHKWAHFLTSHCMGAEPHAEFIKDCLRYFDGRHFVLSTDEKLPLRLRYNYVLLPYIQAVIAREYGYDWSPKNQSIQSCKAGLVIYPSVYFCGQKYKSGSYCQHLVLGGWKKEITMPLGTGSPSKSPSELKKRIRDLFDHFLMKCSYVLIKV